MIVKNIKIRKWGSAYGFLIPKALIEKTDVLALEKIYDIDLKETFKKEADNSKESTEKRLLFTLDAISLGVSA